MAIDGAPPALLDGAPSARLPESEAGVESEVGVESEAGVETERPLTVRDLARKAAQRNSCKAVRNISKDAQRNSL